MSDDTRGSSVVENTLLHLSSSEAFLRMLFISSTEVFLLAIKVISAIDPAGKPIADVLSRLHMPFVNINSKTVNPEQFIKESDVVISAVGKPVIESMNIKEGAALISVGLRSEEGQWIGDYRQNEIAEKSMAFTPTPGGVGPVTVAYLVSNTIKAWKMQNRLA